MIWFLGYFYKKFLRYVKPAQIRSFVSVQVDNGGLCVFGAVAGELIQSAAVAEKLDVQHQFIPGGNAQLLIDAAVVFFYGVYADKGQFRDLSDLVPVNIITQDPLFGGGKGFRFFGKCAEHLLYTIGQRIGIYIAGVHLGQHLHTDDTGLRADDAVVVEHFIDQQKQNGSDQIGNR